MGRREARNNIIDVPWDHYTFNLGGNTDLKPQLRKKVEIIETEVGFCMLYPKHGKRGKGQQNNTRSDDCHNARVVDYTHYSEGRDPSATLHRDATWDSYESISPDAAWQKNRRAALTPTQSRQKKNRNNTYSADGSKEINRILDFEANNQLLLQGSYSSRSFR